MRTLTWALAAWVAATVSTPAQAALELEPTSDWRLREYDDKCRMIRTFGEGEDSVSLWIEKGGPGRYYNVTIIGQPFRSLYGGRIKDGFAPNGIQERGFVRQTSSKGRPVIMLFGVPLIALEKDPGALAKAKEALSETLSLPDLAEPMLTEPEEIVRRFGSVQSLDVSNALVERISLKTGGLLSMASELGRCARDLGKEPGDAPAQEDSRARGATTAGEREWAGSIQRSYPSFLLREMAQGSVGVRVSISPEGRATFCEIVEFIGPAGFNDAACLGMIRHARFNPALNDAGEPVRGRYATRITYRINR